MTETERLAIRRARLMEARKPPSAKTLATSAAGKLGKEASNRIMGSDAWQNIKAR